jgi:hypothetical protein
VLDSPTIADFKKQWTELCNKYEKGITRGVVEYVRKEWIHPGTQEQIVKAWTNQYRHFGTLVTSRKVQVHKVSMSETAFRCYISISGGFRV